MRRADLHTPEELLQGAQALLMSTDEHLTREVDQQLMRAVVLEAITALETFVHKRVFSLLKEQLDPLLVKWLEERTRSDFDSRLSVLTPVALGQHVDRSTQLWNDYKSAKKIRNKVTHSGRKVTREEARFVVRTVYEWLAFLGSTVEVELALQGLKIFIERSNTRVDNEVVGLLLVRDYFSRAKGVTLKEEGRSPNPQAGMPDIILKFGNHTVLVEVTFSHGADLLGVLEKAVPRTLSYLQQAEITRGALIVFQQQELPEPYGKVTTLEDGRLSLVVIRI